MTLINHFSNLTASIGQIDKTFFGYGNMVLFAQVLHSDTDAGFFEAEFFGDIYRADNWMGFAQDKDRFQIVFRGFIYCHWITFLSDAAHLQQHFL